MVLTRHNHPSPFCQKGWDVVPCQSGLLYSPNNFQIIWPKDCQFIFASFNPHIYYLHLFPALCAFWFLKKNRVKQKSSQCNCTNDSTNAKIPLLARTYAKIRMSGNQASKLKTTQPIAKPLRRTSGNQILPFFSSFFPYRQVIFKWQPYATNGAISVPKRAPLTTNNVGFKPPNPIQILG